MAGAEAETRSASAGLRLLVAAAALSPAPATAGAWVAPEGGQDITSSVVGQRADGSVYYEGALYVEEPLGQNTSVVFAPWVETDPARGDGERIEATFTVKHAIYRSGDNVVAVQTGGLWVSDPGEGCGEGGAEVRVLGGHSYSDGRGFINVEAAARALSGGCEGGRAELTVGYRPNERWLGMGQVFLDSPVDGDPSAKAQISLVGFDRSGRGWQIGLRARIDSEDIEPAIVIGLWGRPRD